MILECFAKICKLVTPQKLADINQQQRNISPYFFFYLPTQEMLASIYNSMRKQQGFP